VNDLMVEHRMYLPLAVICVGVCAVGHGLLQRHVPAGARRAAALSLTVLVATALTATTWARCHAYQSRLVMWADVVTKSPRNPRGWQTLALELWQAGVLDRALEAVDKSLAIVPDSAVSLATRKAILAALEQPAKPAGAPR
jgi:hypothetical protein